MLDKKGDGTSLNNHNFYITKQRAFYWVTTQIQGQLPRSNKNTLNKNELTGLIVNKIQLFLA